MVENTEVAVSREGALHGDGEAADEALAIELEKEDQVAVEDQQDKKTEASRNEAAPSREQSLHNDERIEDQEAKEAEKAEEQAEAGERLAEIMDRQVGEDGEVLNPEDPQTQQQFSEYKQELLALLKSNLPLERMQPEQVQTIISELEELSVEDLEEKALQQVSSQLGVNPKNWHDFKNIFLTAMLNKHARDEEGNIDPKTLDKVKENYRKYLTVEDKVQTGISKFQETEGFLEFVFGQIISSAVGEQR
jgi:hypothetical protein